MESIGIPISLLWSSILGMAVFVYVGDKKANNDKFKEIDKKINTNSKQLSRDELTDLTNFIKKEMEYLLNSDNYRSMMKTMITEAIIHSKKNDTISQNHIFDSIQELLNEIKNGK